MTKRAIRATITGKIDYWKNEYDKVASRIFVYELELSERDVNIRSIQAGHEEALKKLRDQIARLSAENDKLRDRLLKAINDENITPIRPTNK